MYAARYYNRALTATEITQNYNALKHRFGLWSIIFYSNKYNKGIY
jgi:hypothetical protein